jgi:hypothetical protein
MSAFKHNAVISFGTPDLPPPEAGVCFLLRPRQQDVRYYRPEKTRLLTPSRRLQAWSVRS